MTMIYPFLIPAYLILSTNALRVSWSWPLTSRSPPREHPWIDRLRSRQGVFPIIWSVVRCLLIPVHAPVPGLSKSEVDFLFLNSRMSPARDLFLASFTCFLQNHWIPMLINQTASKMRRVASVLPAQTSIASKEGCMRARGFIVRLYSRLFRPNPAVPTLSVTLTMSSF